MPRKNRVHYRFAFHHVMLRGNNRKNIFLEESDYQKLLDLVANSADSYHFKVHLYCLMTNHIHLVIEVDNIPISRIMQSITSQYARLHNKKYDLIGHLFQGRFISKTIESDQYLLELCYYIHMNPVKAKMCKLPSEYQWSSHNRYLSAEKSHWFTTEYILKMISTHLHSDSAYRNLFTNYDDPNYKPVFCKFSEDGYLIIQNNINLRNQHKPSLALENVSLKVICEIVCELMQVPFEKIMSDSQARRISLARSMIAFFGHYHAKYTFHDIAAIVCREPSSISKTLRRHLKLATSDREIKKAITTIEKRLSLSDLDKWVL